MTKAEQNLMVIQNFILHITHVSGDNDINFKEPMTFTPEELYRMADEYIEEDHADGKENEENNIEKMVIDLRTCKTGDILISSQGAKLEYISITPWRHYTYLDHVVRYVEDKDGNSMGEENYGTRTHDGFVFANNRIPNTDHDIIKIIHL